MAESKLADPVGLPLDRVDGRLKVSCRVGGAPPGSGWRAAQGGREGRPAPTKMRNGPKPFFASLFPGGLGRAAAQGGRGGGRGGGGVYMLCSRGGAHA